MPADARQFFVGLAGGWAARYQNDPAMAARLDRFAGVLEQRVGKGEAVLDFGCGAGVIARYLAARGFRLSGCDVSSEMIDLARQNANSTGIQWAVCDNGPLPYPDQAFAAVIGSSVLEYVVDLAGSIRDLRRVLKPGGWLLVTVPDTRDAHRRREALMRAVLALPLIGHILGASRWAEGAAYLRLSRNRMSPQGWIRVLEGAGFQVAPIQTCEGPLTMLVASRMQDK